MARMGAIESSCVFDLDATISASYSGSGTTWANYEDSPADGSGQTAYDVQTGDGATSTTYPTFNGSAGSPAAYWSVDGGDYFSLIGALPSFLKNWHKTTGGAPHWIAFAAQMTAGAAVNTVTTGVNGTHGMEYRIESTEAFGVRQLGAGASAVVSSDETGFLTGFNYLLVMSYDPSTNVVQYWINGVRQTDDTITPQTSTTDATRFRIAANCNTTIGGFLTSGSRIYAVSGGQGTLTDVKEAAIRAEYETRHARSYTRSQTQLTDVVSDTGCIFQLDTHLNACIWAGGFNNDWKNACTAPADGSAQSAYDFPDVGAPPFVNFGDADGPRWNNATGDYWQIAANTTFLKSLHKETQDFWLLFVINSDGGLSARAFFATGSAHTTNPGFDVRSDANEDLSVNQYGDSAADGDVFTGVDLTSGWHLFCITYDKTNNKYKWWWNSATGNEVATTFNASVTDPGLATIGANPSGASIQAQDIDWRSVYAGNTVMTDAKIQEIIYYLEDLHNVDYDGDAVIGAPASSTGGFDEYYSRFIGGIGQ